MFGIKLRWVATCIMLVLFCLTLLAATDQPAPVVEAKDPVTEHPNSDTQYLPYGVPVPVGKPISAPPEPHNPSKHGDPIPNTQPEANRVGKPEFKLPDLNPRNSSPNEFPGTGDRGFWIKAGTGVYSGNDAQTNLSIPDNAQGTVIYAPTHMPANKSCVEAATAHWRNSGMSNTAHGHGFWDHCNTDDWKVFESMDSTWKSKYVRIYSGEERFFIQVDNFASGCWRGLLYNFSLGAWETKVSSICGSSTHSDGWTMWESHYLMDQARVCPSFPGIRAAEVKIYVSGSWSRLGTGNSSNLGPNDLCWTNGTYTFDIHAQNYDWHAHTPDAN